MIFRKVHWVHFVGIGGIGMSGIAELLLNLGFKVTGSDMNLSDNVTRIRKLGIDVDIGHDPSNVGYADVLVYSSAVPAENPEIVRARQKGISIIKRAEMLGELINVKPTSIAVGGTHGKTSTSSMIGTILSSAKSKKRWPRSPREKPKSSASISASTGSIPSHSRKSVSGLV